MRHPPTPMQLADFLYCCAGYGHFEAVEDVAMWLVEQSAEARQMYQRLVQMARDIGGDESSQWLHQAAFSHQEFDSLLHAEEPWTDAAEILDPTGILGVRYDYLIRICKARLQRGEEPQRRMAEILRKLVRRGSRH